MDSVVRPKSLFTRCGTCPHQMDCDVPSAPCPPLKPFRDEVDTRMISPINPHLQHWIDSVGGNLDLDVRFPDTPLPALPDVLPAVARKLAGPPASIPMVAITLSRVLSASGSFRYPSREHLLDAYRLPPATKLVLVCVEKDPPLEHLWKNGTQRGQALYRRIAAFGFSAAIGPNYSVFLRRSPLEHRVNYKRALIVAANLSQAGLPTVPHVYAAGPRARDRVVEWLKRHPHISTIAREVQTTKNDPNFYDAVVTTQRIVDDVGRPLHVIFVGPISKARVDLLLRMFPRFSVVSSSAAMLAANHRVLTLDEGRLKRTLDPACIPTWAFERNTRVIDHAFEHLRRGYTYDEDLKTDLALREAPKPAGTRKKS